MNDATIIRTQRDKDHPYIILNKTFANDRRLSWEARGMMTFFLSKPDDWQIWPKALIKESPAGRDAVYRILKELELAGYLTRRQVTSAGKFGAIETIISEVPAHTDEFDRALLSRKRTKDQPYPEKPDTDQPYTEKPEHTNKGSVPSTDSTNKSTTTMREAPSAANAAGGGGRESGIGNRESKKPQTATYAFLRSIGMSVPKSTAYAELPLEWVRARWDYISGNGGAIGGLVLDLAETPVGTAPPAPAQKLTPPRKPYEMPGYATWTYEQRVAADEQWRAEDARYQKAQAAQAKGRASR